MWFLVDFNSFKNKLVVRMSRHEKSSLSSEDTFMGNLRFPQI